MSDIGGETDWDSEGVWKKIEASIREENNRTAAGEAQMTDDELRSYWNRAEYLDKRMSVDAPIEDIMTFLEREDLPPDFD